MDAVFVYGTLKPDRERWHVLAPYVDHLVGMREATVHGRLWATPYGWPALTDGPDRVPGVLVPLLANLAGQALELLDVIEGTDAGLFDRDRLKLEDGTRCWAYRWPASTHDFTPICESRFSASWHCSE